jgi:cell division septation protein DedD
MSMSDDPRGFRRGPGGGRDQAPRQGRGGPSADDRYDGYRQPESRPQRPPVDKPAPAPSFSAYKPEAFAKPEPGVPQERSDWDIPRGQPQAPRNGQPAPDPYSRQAPPQRDPYYSDAASDPYAPRSQQRGYEEDRDWGRDPYQDKGGAAYPNYYPPADEPPPSADAPALHDRFFGSEPEPDPAPSSGGRFRGSYEDHEYDRAPSAFDDDSFTPERDNRRDAGNYNGGFEDGQYYNWDKQDQAPPPPSLRPALPPAIPDDDLDADFFADEDDFDGEDYYEERRGGRKKLIMAVLTGAVVVGGGLAYAYKSTTTGGGTEIAAEDPPAIVADSTPLKQEPAEPGGRQFPNGGKSIYDRLGGSDSGQSADAGSAAEPGGTLGVVTTGTLEERIENALKSQGSGSDSTGAAAASLDAPRVVTTTTFSPDGAQLPAQPRASRVAANAPQPQVQDTANVIVSSQLPQEEPAVEERVGTQQSSGRQFAAVPEQTQPAAPGATGGSGYFVQIGARNEEDAATKAIGTLQQKYGSIIGNYNLAVRRADLGQKGVWYRMMFGPVASKEEGDQLCQQLTGAGLKGCLTRKE